MNRLSIYNSDCRSMSELPDNSVQCIVTSPPYWGLRKYAGVPDLIWGGRPDCEHKWNVGNPPGYRKSDTNPGVIQGQGTLNRDNLTSNICSLCGAWKGQFGLELTVEMYVAHTIEILRECKRVLRPDGVCFWNCADSYYASGGAHKLHHANPGLSKSSQRDGVPRVWQNGKHGKAPHLKPKDLCLIPYRVAIAAQEDGWYVRSSIIWSKPNPMPESVTDRPTDAYEHILMLVKGEWKSRVIEFANLPNERVHLGKNIRLEESCMGNAITQFCISFAASVFDTAQRQSNFSLPPFYSEEWKKDFKASDGGAISNSPIAHRAAVLSALFLNADLTTKEFVCELDSSNITLPNTDEGLMGACPPAAFTSPIIHSDSDRTITINHAGKICKFNFTHKKIIIQSPQHCNYYWDAEAVREPYTEPMNRWGGDNLKANGKSNWDEGTGQDSYRDRNMRPDPAGRNLRNVWTFPTQPYPEAHFATFPEALPEKCIKAATPEYGCCDKCGRPYERIIEHKNMVITRTDWGELAGNRTASSGTMVEPPETKTLGWRQACKCADSKPVPSTVLDPFAGSGTTLYVARKLGRYAIGYELSTKYIKLIENRNMQGVL